MSLLDLFGFITGAICVYLIVRENDWNWSIGILNSAILFIVFFKKDLYAQVGLQGLYIIEGFFGWYKWLQRDKVTKEKVVKISNVTIKKVLILSIIEVVGVILLTFIFKKTADPAPFLDSFITVSSIVAELMLCFKIYQNWAVYLVTDFFSIGLLFTQKMYLIMLTYVVLAFLCVLGLVKWYKSLPGKRGVEKC